MKAAAFLLCIAGSADAAVTISVDAAADRHAISPNIYGGNAEDLDQAQRLKLPFNRWGGGNPSTAYNWKTTMANRASDDYFEDLYGSSGNADDDITSYLAAGIQTIIPVTTIGWISKCGLLATASPACQSDPKNCVATDCDASVKLCSFTATQYPDQVATGNPANPTPAFDVLIRIANNGVASVDGDGNIVSRVTIADPTTEAELTSFAADPTWTGEWVAHLAAEGVHMYQLDNEPGIWDSTHDDLHERSADLRRNEECAR